VTLRMIEQVQWHALCERLSQGLAGRHAEMTITMPLFGSQIQAEWAPLKGVVYEPKSGVFEIVFEGLDHRVRRPQQFYVDEGSAGVAALIIIDGEGRRQEIKLREPLEPSAAPLATADRRRRERAPIPRSSGSSTRER
jgi:hypothetical protein